MSFNRVVLSTGQDICKVTKNGQWTMSKHILLCITPCHMFRSKELLTLINKFGCCESYNFSLEAETAIVNAVHEYASLLSQSIVCNPTGKSIFHSELDNFGNIVNMVCGAGSVFTVHGITLQDINADEQEDADEQGEIVYRALQPQTKERSLKNLPNDSLPDFYDSVTKPKDDH